MSEEAPAISLDDLQIAVAIIDACTKRGSFEGNELLVVGQLREKLVAFVKANTPAEAEKPEEETAE